MSKVSIFFVVELNVRLILVDESCDNGEIMIEMNEMNEMNAKKVNNFGW